MPCCGCGEAGVLREMGATALHASEADGAEGSEDGGCRLRVRPPRGVAGGREVGLLLGAGKAGDRVVRLARRVDLQSAEEHHCGQQAGAPDQVTRSGPVGAPRKSTPESTSQGAGASCWPLRAARGPGGAGVRSCHRAG